MEPGRSSPYWLDRCCLRPSTESRHSRCRILRRSITLPARTAADASPAPSQVPTHGSRRNVDWLLLRSEGLSPSVICQLAWRSYPTTPPWIDDCSSIRCHNHGLSLRWGWSRAVSDPRSGTGRRTRWCRCARPRRLERAVQRLGTMLLQVVRDRRLEIDPPRRRVEPSQGRGQ